MKTVERALAQNGPPVYVRKQIVHNSHVVDELRERGAVFVGSVEDVPEGGLVVFSAHGIAPAVRTGAAARSLRTVDATCPLVTKVHAEAKRYAADGYTVVLVGHAGHEEVEGTMGEAPDSIVLVESVADAERLEVEDPQRVAYVTQTTLSVDETREIVAVLHRRFPSLHGPEKEDICYATTNRQQAVKELLPHVQLLVVLGSANSSNSQRLVEVARSGGVAAHLIENQGELDESWLEGVETVGVTSGASAPETLVEDLCSWFRGRGVPEIRELSQAEENVVFELAGRPPLHRLRETVSALSTPDRELVSQGLHVGRVIDEYKSEFGQGDFLIRGVLGADPESGAIAVGDRMEVGETVQFHVRDAASADEELRALLEREVRSLPRPPAGALLFTCNGRGSRMFSTPDHDAALVSSLLGDVPLAGFFCAGELGPVGGRNFLHGFTASIAVFVEDDGRPEAARS